jgi:hypothetical protein
MCQKGPLRELLKIHDLLIVAQQLESQHKIDGALKDEPHCAGIFLPA